MRLGGAVFFQGKDPEGYAKAHVENGYGAALCPEWITLDDMHLLKEFKAVMAEYDIRIAEVGAWCNPMHPDKKEAKKNMEYMIKRLTLAEELGAATCVNILGTKLLSHWYGAHKDGYTERFFEEAVRVSQRVIDAVKPKNTTLSFEMMPYYFLDSPQEYLRFLKAVERPSARVHLDICNTMNEPSRFYNNGKFITETFQLLRDKIVTLHLKDIWLKEECLTVQFEEVLLGTGGIDYLTLMKEIALLPEDTPAMLEHLETEEEYNSAKEAAERFAKEAGMDKRAMVWK